ncbi:hypothetical protein BT69DRAFT_527349 [Atractiella rhizophila]|nr:hypothetical protein BT69DRAFT_527349 [Atractiella rhizophila]
MLSRAARPSLSRSLTHSQSLKAQVRRMHFENKVYDNMPFRYHNKAGFAFKYFTFISVGFLAPFWVAYYHVDLGMNRKKSS